MQEMKAKKRNLTPNYGSFATMGSNLHIAGAVASNEGLMDMLEEEAEETEAAAAPAGFLQKYQVKNVIKHNPGYDNTPDVLSLLKTQGQRWGSAVLLDMATHVAGDPLGKVKALVEAKITTLLEQADSEAHLAYCDKDIKEETEKRDKHTATIADLTADIKSNTALQNKREKRWFVYLAFLFPAFAGFMFGYDIGAASSCINSLKSFMDVDDLLSSLLTSASLIGATVGSCVVYVVGEPLGRRRELMVGALLYFIGSLLCVLTPQSSALTFILIARIIYGFGIAFSMHAAPVYISEMAPSDVRGLLVSLKEGFIVGGIMFGFAAAAIAESVANCPGGDCPDATGGGFGESDVFRAVWAVPLLTAPIVLVGMYFMPPSPRWLLLRAQRTKATLEPLGTQNPLRVAALTSIGRFRRGLPEALLEAELQEIEATLAVESADEGSVFEVFSSRRALVAGLGLIILQQLTGQPSVLYYQETIFKDAGFGSSASSVSVIVGGAKLLATLCTVSIVDRFGRRPLLFIGISMMLTALVLLTVAFQLATPDLGSGAASDVLLAEGWPPVVVFALVLYVCGYQVGFGPIAWLIISEVFPIRIRTRALSLAVIVNFGFNLGTTFALKPLQTAMDDLSPGKGSSYLFMIYAAFCVLSQAFVYKCVPETKGKTLEEIEDMLR